MTERQLQNLVGGTLVDALSGATMASTNPADTRDVVAKVPAMEAADVRGALDAASAALSSWRATSAPDRGRVLITAAGLIRGRVSELASLISREMGKTVGEATIEAERSADMLEFYGALGRLPLGEVLPDRRPATTAWTLHEPVGLVLLITPWNDPLIVPCRKLAPALVAGNTVVLKPAPDSPATALVLAEILNDAGLPPGVVNTVSGHTNTIAPPLLDDTRVAALSFTGSTATGRHLRVTLADRNVRLQTEMGGKNSVVLMPDADVDSALEKLASSMFGQAGQRCTAASKLLVHQSIYRQVETGLCEMAKKVDVGPGSDPDTTMGPMASERQLDRVLAMIAQARGEGARIAYGGARLASDRHAVGCFIEPTVLTSVEPTMSIWRDEVFGPVVTVVAFETIDEAIDMVNDTDYGLAAGVFTNDLDITQRFINNVEAGQVAVNLSPSGWDIHQPFGGFKDSGSPFKEHGLDGLRFYTRTKTVALSS